MNKNQKPHFKQNAIALSFTIGVHAIAIVGLLFLGLSKPPEQPKKLTTILVKPEDLPPPLAKEIEQETTATNEAKEVLSPIVDETLPQNLPAVPPPPTAQQLAAEKKKAEQLKSDQQKTDAEKKLAEEKRKAEADKNAAEEKRKADADKKAAEEKRKAEADKKAAEEKRKAEAEKKAADEKKRKAEADKKAEAEKARELMENGDKKWMVQVALAANQANADAVVSKLRAKGYKVTTSPTSKGIRIMVGPSKDRDTADAARKKITSDESLGMKSAWVIDWVPLDQR